MLLAVNHPNSFLDAIIIGCHFKQPVYFLARGDAFHKSFALKILTALKCIPVYRLREGKEYLHRNEDTFEKCRAIFKQGGIVLIFSEGLCINEWNIRPLKKGTARLAFSSWILPEIADKLRVLPIGINYSSYHNFPKRVFVEFGEFIYKQQFDLTVSEGANHLLFNQKVATQLSNLCIHGITNNKLNNQNFSAIFYNSYQFNKDRFLWLKQNETKINNQLVNFPSLPYHFFAKKPNFFFVIIKVVLFFILSLPALLITYPFLIIIKKIITKKALNTGHFDSIMLGANTLFFSIYAIIIFIFLILFTQNLILSISIICLLALSCIFLTYFLINCSQIKHLHKNNSKQLKLVHSIYNT